MAKKSKKIKLTQFHKILIAVIVAGLLIWSGLYVWDYFKASSDNCDVVEGIGPVCYGDKEF